MTSTSYAECLELVKRGYDLPTGRVYVAAACVERWRESLFELLNSVRNGIAAAFRPEAVASLQHAVIAVVEALVWIEKGVSVSRVPGINALLFLTGRRSIRDAIGLAAARENEKAVVVAAARSEDELRIVDEVVRVAGLAKCCFNPVEACRILLAGSRACNSPEAAERALVSRTAAFTVTGLT